MNRAILQGFVFALVIFSLADSSVAQTQLNEDRFRGLLSSVVPSKRLKQIDWYPDLLSAQRAAIKQKKPIFIWSMDGHPLGCT